VSHASGSYGRDIFLVQAEHSSHFKLMIDCLRCSHCTTSRVTQHRARKLLKS